MNIDVLDPVELLPRPRLEALQDNRLLAILAHCCEHAPLIRQLWAGAGVDVADIRSRADFFARAPFMNKDTIRAFRDANRDPCGGFVRRHQPGLRGVFTTSGTTGDPTPLPRRERSPFETGYARDHWHIGVRPGDHLLMVAFTFRTGSLHHTFRELGIVPIFLSHAPQALPRMAEALERFRPTVLSVLSNPLMIGLERLFETTGADPVALFSPLRGAIFGGEALGPRYKKMAQTWGLELFETGGLGDVCAATECRVHDGLHAHEDMALVECLEPDGDRPVADGEVGEMVITTLCDPYVPLIRYRTDDLVRTTREPCACGRTHARFKLLGRKGDQVIVGGRQVLPLDLRAVVEAITPTRGGLFQIIRSGAEMAVLRLRVGYDASLLEGGEAALARLLAEEISQALDLPVAIELTPDSELLKLGPPHKIPRVTTR